MLTLSHIASWITAGGDLLFGWLLVLPRDVAIIALALLTSLILTLLRRWGTNQDLLSRCAADLRCLRRLIREAKSRRDKPEVARMQGVVNLVKLTQLRAEGWVLLMALPPLAFLGAWGVERLDYLPPRVGEEVTFRAYYSLSSVNKLTHLVPPEGFELRSPAVQEVRLDEDASEDRGGARGVAEWTLMADAPVRAADFVVRHQEHSVAHGVRVDGRVYQPPVQTHGDDLIPSSEVQLRQARFLGMVSGVSTMGLPPWVVAYLLLAILLVYPLRKLMRVW